MSENFDPNGLREHWIRVHAASQAELDEAKTAYGVDFASAGTKLWETGEVRYLPLRVTVRADGDPRREQFVFAFTPARLVTCQPKGFFDPFEKAMRRFRHDPSLAASPIGIAYALLRSLNEGVERIVDHSSEELAAILGDAAYRGDTYERLDSEEHIVSGCRQSQLQLARAVRHIRSSPECDERMDRLYALLLDDIDAVRHSAGHQHDRIRYHHTALRSRRK